MCVNREGYDALPARLSPLLAVAVREQMVAGRGRTADVPIFRTRDSSSLNTVDVRDLRSRIDPNTDARAQERALARTNPPNTAPGLC